MRLSFRVARLSPELAELVLPELLLAPTDAASDTGGAVRSKFAPVLVP